MGCTGGEGFEGLRKTIQELLWNFCTVDLRVTAAVGGVDEPRVVRGHVRMGVRPLVVVVFGAAEDEAFVTTRIEGTDVDGDVFFLGGVPNPVSATMGDADVTEAVGSFGDQIWGIVAQARSPDVAFAVFVLSRGDEDVVGCTNPRFVASGARRVGAIDGKPGDAFAVGFKGAEVDEFDVGHFIGLNEDAVVAVEGELFVFEVVVIPLGKGAAFPG